MTRKDNRTTQPPPRKGRAALGSLAVSLALVAATAAVYGQVYDFKSIQYDDPGYVFENPNVQVGLSWGAVKWALATDWQSNWHPLAWMSHMVDCQLFGPHAGVHDPRAAAAAAGRHHLVNVGFHIASTLLLFFLLKRMTRTFWPSAAVAALFALHPLHVESVAWIAERKDVLSTLLAMLTLGAYALYAEKPGLARMAAVVVLFALGLMAKPMLVTLPLVMLLLDFWPLGRVRWGGEPLLVRHGNGGSPRPQRTPVRLIAEKIPLFALAAASAVVTYFVQHGAGSMEYGDHIDPATRAANAAASYVAYLEKTFWPASLAIHYPYPQLTIAWYAYAGICAVILAAVTVVVVRAARARPYLAVGWFWYLGMLVPAIGLVQVGSQAMADRYTYMPLIGIFIMVVWGAADLLAAVPSRRNVLAALGGGAVAACMALTYGQVGTWADDFAVFSHAATVTRGNALAYLNLAGLLMDAGKPEEAIPLYLTAIEAHPKNFPFGHNNLGRAYYRLKDYDKAIEEYKRALDDAPGFPEALHSLAVCYVDAGRPEEALAVCRTWMAADPDSHVAHYLRGCALRALGRLDEAERELVKVLQWEPGHPAACEQVAFIKQARGDGRAAAAGFRQALRAAPDQVASLAGLAWLLATDNDDAVRDGAEAVRLAERACKLTGRRQAGHLDTLAAAYAEAGRFAEAVQVEQETLGLLPQREVSPSQAAAFAARLELYKAGKPYRTSGRE